MSVKQISGVGKDTFTMNSRGHVRLQDVELIIKDLLRKQVLLKKHKKFVRNVILGSLSRDRRSIEEKADHLRKLLGIDLITVAGLKKEQTFEYLVSLLENKNIFVSQSVKAYMPQVIQRHVKFSGFCVKDKQIPFIFMNNRDQTPSFEPQGRRILTLILLIVCLAQEKFRAVSYNEQTANLILDDDFELAEEVLMPKKHIASSSVSSLDDVKMLSDQFSVTPSALIMRLRRIGILNDDEANHYFEMLKKEFEKRTTSGHSPSPITAIKKYNGTAYSRAILELMDVGKISKSEVRRVLFGNKLTLGQITDFRDAL